MTKLKNHKFRIIKKYSDNKCELNNILAVGEPSSDVELFQETKGISLFDNF